MNKFKIFALFLFLTLGRSAVAQRIPASISAALKTDNATELATLLNKDSINNCYQVGDWQYSLLAQTIRTNKKKCFDLLIEKGADVI